MKHIRSFSALLAATLFGAVAMASQILLLRRFLWRFEAAETGVALFLSCWLFWSGIGAAFTCAPFGRRLTGALSRAVWPLIAVCVSLYFVQYALIGDIRAWLGVSAYEAFPLLHLALGCFVANAPFGLVAGLVIPAVCRRLADLDVPVSRAFAWEALGAAAGGFGVTLLLVAGVSPDPRDEAEWFRYFPKAVERPGRFETGGGTTFYGTVGGSFYALSSGGVSEMIPEGDRSMDAAALLLSQRPYARRALLLGDVSLAVGLSLEALRPDLDIVWCPCDAAYGVRLLGVLRAAGLVTRVSAAGETPQRFIAGQSEGAFDAVLVNPPPATTLEGAEWRLEAFARSVRRVTQRTGVALFGLACGAEALTPEKVGLLEAYVGAVRSVWPEDGRFAVGAGGWWVAAQVQNLAYDGDAAASRFALLKRSLLYPSEAIPLLYDPQRAERLAQPCPLLGADWRSLQPPGLFGEEDVLAWGLADAVRRAYPTVSPATWMNRIETADGIRVLGMLLVALWMFPVVCGSGARASRRLSAVWLAACGALGLVCSLSVLDCLQVRLGSLYLFAGAGSCLYLAGLYCGNRCGDVVVCAMRGRLRMTRTAAVVLTLVQSGLAWTSLRWAASLPTALCLICLCFIAGCAAGAAVPLALSLCGDDAADNAAVCVVADAIGSAAGGLLFVLFVPFGGLHGALACYALLACGCAVCVALGSHHARLSAALALIVALAVVGGRLRDAWPDESQSLLPETQEPAERQAGEPALQPARTSAVGIVGVPRKVDVDRVRRQMRSGALATNPAAFWTPE